MLGRRSGGQLIDSTASSSFFHFFYIYTGVFLSVEADFRS